MIRVMLVDDEEDALNLLEILLGRIGNVEVAGRYMNSAQALEALSQFPVDAVFLDNHMPGMKGTDAARKIRRVMPKLPIVFTTAYSEYAVEAFELQSTDYLMKPFTLDRLQDAVARIRQTMPDSAVPAERPFEVQCLGGFRIQAKGGKKGGVSWKTKKEKELCAFLIHYGGKSANTASIIEALWPGYDLNKAKTYLYTCLSYLRRSLAENDIPIRIDKSDQGFCVALDEVTVDVIEFERLLDGAKPEAPLDGQAYDRMNRMYQGEYMEACDFDWAATRQLEMKAAYIRALREGYAYYRGQGNRPLAMDSLQRILTLAPESEQDGRELIVLHLEAGHRNEAYRVCLQLEQAVRDQLGAELEEKTLRLIEQTKINAAWQDR